MVATLWATLVIAFVVALVVTFVVTLVEALIIATFQPKDQLGEIHEMIGVRQWF